MVKRTFLKAAFYIWLVLIFVFSVIPNDAEAGSLLLFDLSGTGFLKHVFAYFISSVLLIFAYKNETLKFFFKSLILLFVGSILIECIQYLLPYRSFSLSDMAANLLGIILFFGPFWIYSVMTKGSVKPIAAKY